MNTVNDTTTNTQTTAAAETLFIYLFQKWNGVEMFHSTRPYYCPRPTEKAEFAQLSVHML
jgi:hypothetical protein